ncbi:MAG: hypothetical protein ACFFDH_03110 [Promethearchaeota archaeon]
MPVFLVVFWIIEILLIFSVIFLSIFLAISHRKHIIRRIVLYFLILSTLVFLSTYCEIIISNNFNTLEIILIFDLELLSVIILFTVLYYVAFKNPHSDLIIYFNSTMILIILHITISGVNGLLIKGTIMVSLIGTLVFIITIPYDIEYKLIATAGFFGLTIYISILLNELILMIVTLGLIFITISLSTESFRDRIVSIYQTLISSIKKSGEKILNPLYNNSSGKNLKIQKNKKKRILFWQSRVKIFQGTHEEKDHRQINIKETNKTWLQDFFSNRSSYGLKLVSQRDFAWTLLMKSKTKAKARIQGEALLTRLLSIFPGTDGNLDIIPITKRKIYKNHRFWEIRLPRPPYRENFTIIKDFINLFHRNTQKIKLYIIWKRATARKIMKIREKVKQMKYKDEEEKKEFLKKWQEELYKIKIFVNYYVIEKDQDLAELEVQKIEGMLKSLTMSGRNLKKAALIKRVPSGTIGNIQRLNLFSGSYVTPLCVDFDIPEISPLVKPFKIENENIKYIPKEKNDPNYILIGRHVSEGRRTEHPMLIQKKSFAQSVLIAGQQGTGKTYLLAQVLDEFYKKASDIGILIINLGKGNQEGFYKVDKVIKFGFLEFWVPYFIEGQYLERSIQETATYLIASTGLKNIVEKNMVIVMQAFIEKKGKLPRSLKFLFTELIRYFKLNPYHVKFQTNILRAIKNRVLSLLSNPELQKAINLKDNSKIPVWFKEWRNGKKIYLDLSKCTIYEKRLLTNAIFQMIRALTPDIELGRLQNIILIDEAHQILEKPISNNYDDDDYISREQLEKIFNELLREFRSKGLSFILADQTPSRLFECVTLLPSLKIVFRVGYPCNTRMIGNPKEQEFLMLQKNRQALILNGITGEKYVIETLDFKLPDMREHQLDYIKTKIGYCPYCDTKIDFNSSFCIYCGKPFLVDLEDFHKNLDINSKNLSDGEIE